MHNASPAQKKTAGVVKLVVGTGAAGIIKTVKTKLVSIFTSKFSPELDTEMMSTYLKKSLVIRSTVKSSVLYKTDTPPFKYLLNAMRCAKCTI